MSTGLANRNDHKEKLGRGSSVEETGLSVREESQRELAPSAAQATARYEMEGAIVLARRFPRNEDNSFGKLMKSCQRATFAEETTYSFPRGGAQVKGPSVYLAKEAARIWGNIRYGLEIVADDEDNRHIRGWAWDLETNAKVSAEDQFAKLIFRKNGGWQKPDERDLRELTNRRGAILVRNCLLDLLPSDLVEDALRESEKTLANKAGSNIDEQRKSIILAFSGIGVSVEQLEVYLKHPLAQCSPPEIVNLRTVYKSIKDGNSKWSEYVAEKPVDTPKGPVSSADLTGGASVQSPAAELSQEQIAQDEFRRSIRVEFSCCTTIDQCVQLKTQMIDQGELSDNDLRIIGEESQARCDSLKPVEPEKSGRKSKG